MINKECFLMIRLFLKCYYPTNSNALKMLLVYMKMDKTCETSSIYLNFRKHLYLKNNIWI